MFSVFDHEYIRFDGLPLRWAVFSGKGVHRYRLLRGCLCSFVDTWNRAHTKRALEIDWKMETHWNGVCAETTSLDIPVSSIQSCMSRRWGMVCVPQLALFNVRRRNIFLRRIFRFSLTRCWRTRESEFLFFALNCAPSIQNPSMLERWVWQIEMWCYSKYDFFLSNISLSAILDLYLQEKPLYPCAVDAFFFVCVLISSACTAHPVCALSWCCSGKHVNGMNCESGFLSIHSRYWWRASSGFCCCLLFSEYVECRWCKCHSINIYCILFVLWRH